MFSSAAIAEIHKGGPHVQRQRKLAADALDFTALQDASDWLRLFNRPVITRRFIGAVSQDDRFKRLKPAGAKGANVRAIFRNVKRAAFKRHILSVAINDITKSIDGFDYCNVVNF